MKLARLRVGIYAAGSEALVDAIVVTGGIHAVGSATSACFRTGQG